MEYTAYECEMYNREAIEQDVLDWLNYEADMAEQGDAIPTDEEMEKMAKALA